MLLRLGSNEFVIFALSEYPLTWGRCSRGRCPTSRSRSCSPWWSPTWRGRLRTCVEECVLAKISMLSLKKYAIPYTVLYGEPSDENGLGDGKVSMLIGFVGFWVSHLKVFHYVHCFMQFLQFLGCWELEIIILTWKAGIVLRIRARVDTMTKPMEITAITCDRVWNRILGEQFFVGNVNLVLFEAACFRWSKSPVVLYFVDGITRNVPVSIHLRGVQSHYWYKYIWILTYQQGTILQASKKCWKVQDGDDWR